MSLRCISGCSGVGFGVRGETVSEPVALQNGAKQECLETPHSPPTRKCNWPFVLGIPVFLKHLKIIIQRTIHRLLVNS